MQRKESIMAAEIYHWQCDFCGAIVNTDVYSVRKKCSGVRRKGKKCGAFMKRIDDEQLATYRSAVFKKLREFEKGRVQKAFG